MAADAEPSKSKRPTAFATCGYHSKYSDSYDSLTQTSALHLNFQGDKHFCYVIFMCFIMNFKHLFYNKDTYLALPFVHSHGFQPIPFPRKITFNS